jgi:hypothetical protein
METAAHMKLPSIPKVAFPKKQAVRFDRVSKGIDALPGVDGRTRFAKRYEVTLDGLVAEFNIIEQHRLILAKEAAHISAWLDLYASRAVGGGSSNEKLVNRRQNTLRRATWPESSAELSSQC